MTDATRASVRRVIACALAAASAFAATDASARGVRRRFDPDDLEFDTTGVARADFALGAMRGEDAGRWLVPDFDVDVAIATNVELGLDSAIAVEGSPTARFAFDHASPDVLWLSSKVGLYDARDEAGHTAWAAGVQLGPRLPTARGAHGAGFQAIGLLGRTVDRARLVLNVGGLVDPGLAVAHGRPAAVLTGFDATLDLDAKGTWSLMADVSGVFFLSDQKSQLATTFGPTLAVTSWLDVSVNALVGVLAGGDRYGAFVQLSPKVRVF